MDFIKCLQFLFEAHNSRFLFLFHNFYFSIFSGSFAVIFLEFHIIRLGNEEITRVFTPFFLLNYDLQEAVYSFFGLEFLKFYLLYVRLLLESTITVVSIKVIIIQIINLTLLLLLHLFLLLDFLHFLQEFLLEDLLFIFGKEAKHIITFLPRSLFPFRFFLVVPLSD